MNATLAVVPAVTPDVIPTYEKTVTNLAAELATLENELASTARLAGQVNALGERLQRATTGHVLGTVTTIDLQRAQREHEDAVDAINRQGILNSAVREARASLAYAQSQERQQFIRSIHNQFAQVRERYVIASKSLLELFREMHRLNVQAQSMHSTPLLSERDFKLDLPAIRRDADSELFSIGQMLRDGGY